MSDDQARLAQMSRQAADLGGLAKGLDPERAAQLLEQAEIKGCLRCGGCRRRIEFGMEFVKMSAMLIQGQEAVEVQRVAACVGHDDCDFAQLCLDAGAECARPIEFVWPRDAAQASATAGPVAGG